jgi:regulator of replication initiation timing
MIKMSTVNFSKRTIENLEVSCDDIKEIKFEFLDNTLRLSIVKENEEEVIEEIIKEEMEDVEVVNEEPTEDVIEEKVIEKLTIDDLKKIIYETIPKKNTAETYFRSVKQVYDNFKDDDVYDLFKKENEIIEYIETKYDKLSTIKNKLCGMLKVYSLLNLESNVLKSKIDHYMVSLSIQEDKKKEDSTDKKNNQRSRTNCKLF